LRVIVAEKKQSYIFSCYEIVDLLAILPFYLSGSVGLQALKVLSLDQVIHNIEINPM